MNTSYIHSTPSMTAGLLPSFIYPPITPRVAPTREINHLLDQSHALASRCEISQSIKLFLKAEQLWNEHGNINKEDNVYLLVYRGFLYSLYYQTAEDNVGRASLDLAVVCYMEAIDLAESTLPHTADTALPRIYLALELYYARCYEKATVLLKQAEAIVRNAEGPRSLLVHICSYNILACYVVMLQYSNEYRAGLLSTLAADQLHGNDTPFPIDHHLIKELGSLGVQSFQGLSQQYKYLDNVISNAQLLEPPEHRRLDELLAMGLGQQGELFRKDVLEKIKSNPQLYEGCNSLIMFDFLQSSEFLQAGSLGICQPEALLGKELLDSKTGSPGTNTSLLFQTTANNGPRISSLAKDLTESRYRREQERIIPTTHAPFPQLANQQLTNAGTYSLSTPSSGVPNARYPSNSASDLIGITPPGTRAMNSDHSNVGMEPLPPISHKLNFPVETLAYTMDEDGLYAVITELSSIEKSMCQMVGSTHYYTTAVQRLQRICEGLQEATLLRNDQDVMTRGLEAFKHKFRYLSSVEVKPKMLGSGGKPKKEKGKKGSKGKKGKAKK
ncbi:Hypothetical protein GLP15_1218 [Giardia lamblia P15]|uniref:Uncharacterized protein n=1 Tax=Giardia intestinalis (strain P15) TaxID=658858 RepID=E1EZU2_GIAIA|nr:Hypothetical protein GLP15_1218 [Giardia lamblia P15]